MRRVLLTVEAVVMVSLAILLMIDISLHPGTQWAEMILANIMLGVSVIIMMGEYKDD